MAVFWAYVSMNVLDEKTKKYIEIASIRLGRIFEIRVSRIFRHRFCGRKGRTPIVIETNMRRTGVHMYMMQLDL